jgi:hypothetical protein
LLTASNASTPLRDAPFHRRPSIDACSTRRSVVNDCSAPADPPGTHERDEVRRPQLAIDERMERAPGVLHALDGQPEIVNDQGERALYVLPFEGRRRQHCPAAAECSGRDRIGDRGRAGQQRNELRVGHVLPLAILAHVELGRGQVAHDAAVPIGHHGIEPYDVDPDPEARLRRLLSVNRP